MSQLQVEIAAQQRAPVCSQNRLMGLIEQTVTLPHPAAEKQASF
jgi:hypothetical protein